MAAFCSCCGAELTLKAEVCAACGTPRHGMTPADRKIPDDKKDGGRKTQTLDAEKGGHALLG